MQGYWNFCEKNKILMIYTVLRAIIGTRYAKFLNVLRATPMELKDNE